VAEKDPGGPKEAKVVKRIEICLMYIQGEDATALGQEEEESLSYFYNR
jgi:hypothetical protein